jgi:NDP-sugar pyrophosphorylase family protein
MKAMILAAGLGTRLRPLTDNRPKALVEIAGRTLLEITLTRLRTFGITEVIVNVHHFANQVIDYLKSHNNFNMRIEISREEVLLDTGGGLKKAAWFFLEDPSRLDEPFLLHNVDVISTIDFARMLQFHTEHHALATLAVQARESGRQLLFNDHHQLSGRRTSGTVPSGTAIPGCAPQTTATQNPSGATPAPIENAVNCHSERSDERPTRSASPESYREESAFSESQAGHSEPYQSLAFSGIHIISPRLLPLLTEEGIFSIIPSYLRLSAQGQKILAFRADDYSWRDLGRPSDLAQAAHELQQKNLL